MEEKLLSLWQYIRGDMSTKAFENFIYNEPDLEEMLGEELYLEVISANYNKNESLHDIDKKIEAFLYAFQIYSCQCHRLQNRDTVGMGWEEEFFTSFEVIRKQDETNRWLYISQCSNCHQRWLIAEEGIYSDDYYLYRLSEEEYLRIENENKWPAIFLYYENLPLLGPVFQNANNISNPSVMYQLAKKNPGMMVEDLANLLNISLQEATDIAT